MASTTGENGHGMEMLLIYVDHVGPGLYNTKAL